ncbi:hypothetical protein QTP88_019462 [Uroleucon formosanum]
MSNLSDEDYKRILEHLQANDLKALFESSGQNNTRQRTELQKLASELFSSELTVRDYDAYISKICEIYHLLPWHRSDTSDNNMMHSSIQTQQMPMSQILMPHQTIDQVPEYHQQSMNMPQARGIYGNSTDANTIPGNTMANNHIQYASGSHQPVRPQIIVPSPCPSQMPSNLQNMDAMKQNTSELVFNASTSGNNNAFIPSLQVIANYKFKNIPFYDVIEDIMKPTLLDGLDKCTLSNLVRGSKIFMINSSSINYTFNIDFISGMKECTFAHIMTMKQVNYITVNRDISFGRTDYEYQFQIRICQLDKGECDEVTDDLPMGLHIRVGKNLVWPPLVNHDQSEMKCKQAAVPINIAQYLKLTPILPNIITINWIPDGKKYALAMFIVKQVSVDTLMRKLLDKNPISSRETRNYIIKKLTNIDPDLTTTSSNTFSFICPLSKVKIKIPAKSIHCDHIQCFDAETFILLNKKNPKWMCPICNKSCLYDDIQILNYFFEIISSLSFRDDVNVIEVLADGSWIIPEENKDAKNMNITIVNKEKSIDFIELDDIVNEKCVVLKEEPSSGGSKCQESENLKPHLIDVIKDEDEEQSK